MYLLTTTLNSTQTAGNLYAVRDHDDGQLWSWVGPTQNTGMRFSSKGTTIQWENTGSGYMALNVGKYEDDNGGLPYQIRDSIIKRQVSTGIPGTFQTAEQTMGHFNTGYEWSYFRTPHLASTVYCVLSILHCPAVYPPVYKHEYNPYNSSTLYTVTGKLIDMEEDVKELEPFTWGAQYNMLSLQTFFEQHQK
jgi:hypothetical protein